MDSIESQILDFDGSCRDITFSDLTPERAAALLHIFGETFTLHIARDDEGIRQNLIEALKYLNDAATGWLHTVWTWSGVISRLQLFLSWEDRKNVFAEITFFPDDVDKARFSLGTFAELLTPLLDAAGAEHFFVRYENASWKFGDRSEYAGVIFSDEEFRAWGRTTEPTR